MVIDLLIEESNIQPVSTPVTVCGDIHGQVGVIFPQSSFSGAILTDHFSVCSFMISKNYSEPEDKFRIQITYLWAILWIVATLV